jgi:two-component system secretion system response regulator SalR
MSNASSMRVLLVEDSALLAGRISELILRLPGVELIGTVDNEADALKQVTISTPDALILDLHLREGSGFGVLRSLPRTGAPRPRVIVLSGFDLPQYRREAETLGADEFLNKSRDYHRLPVLLQSYAASRQTH